MITRQMITRKNIGLMMSVILMTAAMLIYPQFFLFAKTVYLPPWTHYLPSPKDAGKYMAFVALLPALLVSIGVQKPDYRHFLKTFFLAPTVGMMIPMIHATYRFIFESHFGWIKAICVGIANASMLYIWMIGSAMLPSLVMMLPLLWIGNKLMRVVAHLRKRNIQ